MLEFLCSKDDQENTLLADKEKVTKWLRQVQTKTAMLKAIKADFKENSVNSQTGVCCGVFVVRCCGVFIVRHFLIFDFRSASYS